MRWDIRRHNEDWVVSDTSANVGEQRRRMGPLRGRLRSVQPSSVSGEFVLVAVKRAGMPVRASLFGLPGIRLRQGIGHVASTAANVTYSLALLCFFFAFSRIQRAAAALRAICWRCFELSFLALALPPFEGAPFATASFAKPTASGFFLIGHKYTCPAAGSQSRWSFDCLHRCMPCLHRRRRL